MNLNKIRIWECRESFTLLLPILDTAWNSLYSQRHRHLMLTCPEKRPLVNPIPLKIGHSIHEIPLVGAFGSMVCHAAFQGKQAESVQVGGRERHIHTGQPWRYPGWAPCSSWWVWGEHRAHVQGGSGTREKLFSGRAKNLGVIPHMLISDTLQLWL